MTREKKTIELMIRMYCAGNHAIEGGICPECDSLLEYAVQRLNNCPFGEKKTACSKCSIHCYSQPMRTKVTSVMRYSGPRMMSKHPILAFSHVLSRGPMPIRRLKKETL